MFALRPALRSSALMAPRLALSRPVSYRHGGVAEAMGRKKGKGKGGKSTTPTASAAGDTGDVRDEAVKGLESKVGGGEERFLFR